MWIVFALLSAITAAAVAIFGKMALQHVDPTFATAIRAVIMALLMVVLTLSLKKLTLASFAALSGKEWTFIMLAALAGALSWLFYFIALKQGPATAVSALDRLSIVFVVVAAGMFLGEPITWRTLLGSIAVAGGVFLITFK